MSPPDSDNLEGALPRLLSKLQAKMGDLTEDEGKVFSEIIDLAITRSREIEKAQIHEVAGGSVGKFAKPQQEHLSARQRELFIDQLVAFKNRMKP